MASRPRCARPACFGRGPEHEGSARTTPSRPRRGSPDGRILCLRSARFRPPRRRVRGDSDLGVTQDHDAFVSLQPEPDLLTVFDLGAAAEVEHLEVACYTGQLRKAQIMGQSEIAEVLQRILKQEQDAIDELEDAAEELGQQVASA